MLGMEELKVVMLSSPSTLCCLDSHSTYGANPGCKGKMVNKNPNFRG